MSFSVFSFAEDPGVLKNNDYHRACLRGDMATALNLLEQGADINTTNSDMPALLVAVHGQHFALALALLEKGAIPNCTNRFGAAPLHFAAQYGHLSLVQALVEQSAFVQRKDRQGDSALSYAIAHGHEEVCKYLLERGAEVNTQNKDGETPLHIALKQSPAKESIVQMLLDRDAICDIKNNEGKVPSEVTEELHLRALIDKAILKRTMVQSDAARSQDDLVSVSDIQRLQKEENDAVKDDTAPKRRRILKA